MCAAPPSTPPGDTTREARVWHRILLYQCAGDHTHNLPPPAPFPPPPSQAFDDIDGLLEGPSGFDSSSAVWHQTGWREVAALRRKLEDLRELRELVRQLGRGGGKGPLKKAPEQVAAAGRPPGVLRSPLRPEETRGLTRSGAWHRLPAAVVWNGYACVHAI